MKTLPILALALLAQPLAAQAWDLRLEAPFPKGQGLTATSVQGTPVWGGLDTGQGVIFTVGHRIVRVGPVLKFEWDAEYSQFTASGQIHQGAAASGSTLRQSGIGAGVNAQFWVPFTGFAGELGLIERIHDYRFSGGGAERTATIARPWLRAGALWNLPLPGIAPFLAASYQVPINHDHPMAQGSASSLGSYLDAQGAGQEVQRLWTLGVGVAF